MYVMCVCDVCMCYLIVCAMCVSCAAVRSVRHVMGCLFVFCCCTSTLTLMLSLVSHTVGALAASMLGYIIPGALYIKTYETEFWQCVEKLNWNSNAYEPVLKTRISQSSKFILPVFLLCFGGMAMVTGIGSVLWDLSS